MYTFCMVLLIIVHMYNLNTFQHSNSLFIWHAINLLIMIGGINFQYIRKEEWAFDKSVVLQNIILVFLATIIIGIQHAFLKLDIYNIFDYIQRIKFQKDELHNLLDEMFEAVLLIRQDQIQFSNKVFKKLIFVYEENIQMASQHHY